MAGIARRAVLLSALATPALAQVARPIRFIVPFTPGGSTDILARVIAPSMAATLRTSIVVENRPGAGGTVGAEATARATADGSTIMMGHIGTLAVNPSLYPRLPYDPERAFAPVCLVATVANILAINPAIPTTTVAEFLAHARRAGRPLNFGSGGNGSAAHLALVAFQEATGIAFTHVPYRGTGPMLADLIAGAVDLTMSGGPPLLPPIRGGQLRALGVSSLQRISAAPDLPTIAETVPGFEATQWYGVVGPAGMAREVVARLNAAVAKALETPEAKRRLEDEGAEAAAGPPEHFGAFIASESARWGALIRRAGMTLE